MIDCRQKLLEFKTLSEEDRFCFLVKYWKLEDCVSNGNTVKLVGKYQKSERLDKRGKEFGFFVDIRNTEGDILYYPFGLGEVKIVVNHKDIYLKEDFWIINVKLASGPIIEKNPCTLILSDQIVGKPSNKFQDKINKEQLVKKIFNETGATQRDAKNTANALRSIMGDLYTETERFIYELLQNADDQPDVKSEVSVVMHLLSSNFLFMHNGKPFDAKDVESISSIGDSTKKEEANKIGYKGIGFKSVFSDSETVYINSANFSFSFDKHSWYYKDVENIDEIPWQLKPIWAEKYRYPQEVQNDADYFKFPVSIDLSLEKEIVHKYSRIIPQLLKDPTFIIFLRNIKSIKYIDDQYGIINITKSNTPLKENITRCDIFSNSNNLISSWLLSDYIIDVPQIVRDNLKTDKLTPKKLEQTKKVKITFAAKIDVNGQIEPYKQSTLYAYLPTKVSDFNLPLIINADFLTTASRETIHLKNQWNIFLFENIGKFLTNWAISLSSISSNYLQLLPQTFDCDEQNNKYEITSAFNLSYKVALQEEKIILNQNDTLTRQDNIILDQTGLSEIIGADVFCSILQTEKTLPSSKIDTSILKRDIFEKIEKINLSKIVDGIKSSEILNNWYNQSETIQKENLHQWLIKNIELCREIIYDLPLFVFDEETLSYNKINTNDDYIITTEHIKPIKDTLEKIGFYCSKNNLDDITLNQYISATNESVLFERIVAKISTATLTNIEKISLFLSLKDFEDVGDVKLSKLPLFCNIEGTPTPLSQMLPYRADAPTWLHQYVICQEENFEELKKYVVPIENEFNNIVWPHLDEIPISVTELFNIYKWTDQKYTQELIQRCVINNDFKQILPIIKEASKATQQLFLNSIKKIELTDDNESYSKDSYESQVLQLALEVCDHPSDFSQKVFYNGICLTDYSVKDEVVCEYDDNGTTKKVIFSLALLLPELRNQSEVINHVKDMFEYKHDLDRFFIAKKKPLSEIYNEINRLYSVYNGDPWPIDKTSNAYQYLFCVYYIKEVKGFTSSYVKSVKLEEAPIEFVNDLMNFCFSNKLDIELSPFTYRIKAYIIGKFFKNQYILDSEQLIPSIEIWADTNEKKQYLIKNGVKTEDDIIVKFRQQFLNDEHIDFIDKLSESEIISILRYLSQENSIKRPYHGVNMRQTLLSFIEKRIYRLCEKYNTDELTYNAIELDTKEYRDWRRDGKPQIYMYHDLMPKLLTYNDVILLEYNNTKYYYENNKLFITNKEDINSLIFEIARQDKYRYGLEMQDYQALCLDGKVLISQEEKETLETENRRLSDEVKRLTDELKRFKYIDSNTGNSKQDVEATQLMTEPNTSTMSKGEDSILSKDEQIEAQLEAQKFLIQMYPNWTFPNGFGYDENNYTTASLYTEKHEKINIVLKSYKKRDEPFKINIPEWNFIMEDDAQIWIYTGNEIVKIDVKELLKNQKQLSISFNTNNLDEEDKIQQFADAMRYFKELHLDFECFRLSEKAIPIDQLYNTHEGKQNMYSDEDSL